jgi:hypothetical protein
MKKTRKLQIDKKNSSKKTDTINDNSVVLIANFAFFIMKWKKVVS